MRIVQYNDPHEFAARVRPMLMQRECENCWQLGAIDRLCRDAQPDFSPLLLSIESENEIEGVAMQTSSHGLVVTHLPGQAVPLLVEKLAQLKWQGQGISGSIPATDALTAQWCAARGKSMRLHLNLRVFQLTQVRPPAPALGCMERVTIDLLDLMTRWREDFSRALAESDPGARQMVKRMIDEERLFVWRDQGQLRCMTAVAGPTPNGIRINHVYTPPEFRMRGYASNLVATVSQRMLDSGKKFCFLFTDLANPTSNKIYQQIGYQPVADFNHWSIVDASG